MKKVLVLGGKTFLKPDAKVGLQFIAQGLAKSGWEVHYISTASSPMDIFLRPCWRRFSQAWLKHTDVYPVEVQPRLWEHVLKTPFPQRKEFWHWPVQLKMYNMFVPRTLKQMNFDLCIHDTSRAFLFNESIQSRQTVYRLSDKPEGFEDHFHPMIIHRLFERISHGTYSEIWPVSEGLKTYIEQKKPRAEVCKISNGVDLDRFKPVEGIARRPKSAVYVGGLEVWFDWKLLDKAAQLLPDWTIDLYGPAPHGFQSVSPNIRYCGIVKHEKLPNVLSRYGVGLIPFKETSKLMDVMERPLKFYEYLACGLGVAITDVGVLKKGMGQWSRVGKTPQEFAQAMVKALKDADCRRNEKDHFLVEFSWEQILAVINRRLEHLIEI